MNSISIFQIFYSEKTLAQVDPDFIPLDNTANLRPDWMGYWSTRNFLLGHELEDSHFYGFLSPKFRERTGLSGAQTKEFVLAAPADVDVVCFSPFIDQGALYANVLEQGEAFHPGLTDLAKTFFAEIGQPLDTGSLITDSSNTLFCNYFVARPRFWRTWLELCERIFNIAEDGSTLLGQHLNALTNHSTPTPIRVFLIERMASLILATQSGWKVKAYNPYLLPLSTSPISNYPMEMLACDAFKTAYRTTGFQHYLDGFRFMQRRVFEAIQNGKTEESGAGDGNRTHGSSLGS